MSAGDAVARAKDCIFQELDSVVKFAAANFSPGEKLSDDVTQALCNVLEAVFIHGLKDAFFVKNSRYFKYPEPITSLKQIRNEVGKARAWIRIVLNEATMENYTNVLSRDESQLRVFYYKTAFIRNLRMIEAINGHLRTLSKFVISAPTNSSFLNNWTPSPLTLAGLIEGNSSKGTTALNLANSLSKKHNITTKDTDSEHDEATEFAMNAIDLIDESSPSEYSAPAYLPSPVNNKLVDLQDDDDKSSVYSHPSMLDGAMASIMQRANFAAVLSSTPEYPAQIKAPTEELSSEVVVHRRKARTRRISKCSSGGSGNNSRSASESRSTTHNKDNRGSSAIVEASSTSEHSEKALINDSDDATKAIDNITTLDLSEVMADIDDGRNDSGIEQNDEEKISMTSPEINEDLLECTNTSDIINKTYVQQARSSIRRESYDVPIVNKIQMEATDPQEIYGTSLHDELNFSSFDETVVGSDPISVSYVDGHNFSPLQGNRCEAEPSCSSSASTDFSGPLATFDSALKEFARRNEIMDPTEMSLESITPEEACPFENSARSAEPGISSELVKSKDISTIPLHMTKEMIIENDQPSKCDEEDETSRTLLLLTSIPVEKGLPHQDFRCPTCRLSIGGSFSSCRFCNLDGLYYCEDCFKHGDVSILPSRVILNWDCRSRPISKASKNLLKSVCDNPILRIDSINPLLYDHSKLMKKILDLRKKLSLAVMYLLSCKQSIAEDIKRRASSSVHGPWPKDYLYSDIHLYSVTDLENVLSGVMERRLNSLISFAINHINSCPLCLQKGFVCELCSSKRVIYPFQTDIVHRCKVCFSVFHKECIKQMDCPKCLRRRQSEDEQLLEGQQMVSCNSGRHPLAPFVLRLYCASSAECVCMLAPPGCSRPLATAIIKELTPYRPAANDEGGAVTVATALSQHPSLEGLSPTSTRCSIFCINSSFTALPLV
ncbi:putative zinc-RING and/or ribbon domain-containing protein [Ditylenchus destructor]|nr:putative zinc-RING and/or ribbon domain-containing protein [Ditylenchus destructor]